MDRTGLFCVPARDEGVLVDSQYFEWVLSIRLLVAAFLDHFKGGPGGLPHP